MEIGNGNNKDWGSKADNHNTGKGVYGDLMAVLKNPSMYGNNNQIPEVEDVLNSLNDSLESIAKNGFDRLQKSIMPKAVRLTSEINTRLPGIMLYNQYNGLGFVMPVLFYRSGVTDMPETIGFGNNELPQQMTKLPVTYMTEEVMIKVRNRVSSIDNANCSDVKIVSPMVVDIGIMMYTASNREEAVNRIVSNIIKEWESGLRQNIILIGTQQGLDIPVTYNTGETGKGSHGRATIFGHDQNAIALVSPENKIALDGIPSPYNLSVKVTAVPRNSNMFNHTNPNNTRLISKTYLNVSLEALNNAEYQQAKMRHSQMGSYVGNLGPLLPVISIGRTIPGEQLQDNVDIFSSVFGLFAAIAAGRREFFSEAFRGKDCGYRGSLINFNESLSQSIGLPADKYLTDKNIINLNVVNDYIANMVSANPVYCMDLGNYGEDISNTDFWFNIAAAEFNGNFDSTYHRTLMKVLNIFSSNSFSEIVRANAANQSRNKSEDWATGDAILYDTPIIVPYGWGREADGQWSSLEEIDGMKLRSPNFYGNNDQEVSNYLGLSRGQGNLDMRLRQLHLTNRLREHFGPNNLELMGFKQRKVISSGFMNTIVKAMRHAGTITSSGPNSNSMWSNVVNNPYMEFGSSVSYGQQNNNASGFNFGTGFSGF